MPCIPVPSLPIPTLPDGVSVDFPLPSPPSVDIPTPCCLQAEFVDIELPIVLPAGTLNIATVATIRTAIRAVNEWLESLPLTCPRS